MGSASWAVPVGVLCGIIGVALIFIWYFFPKYWQKGVNKDDSIVNQAQGADREAQRAKNREIIERFKRARALERGEIVEEPVELNEQAPPPYEAKTTGNSTTAGHDAQT